MADVVDMGLLASGTFLSSCPYAGSSGPVVGSGDSTQPPDLAAAVKGGLVAGAAVPFALTVVLGAGFSSDEESGVEAGINAKALPALAREVLPQLDAELKASCPELPTLWVLAETESESRWDPRAFSSAGAAGLLQMMPGTWAAAGGNGGSWSKSTGPDAEHPVWQPQQHLRVAIGWMCDNLRLLRAHLRATGKPIETLDALAVCHIAGCSRVLESVSGIPRPGEASCDAGCVTEVRDYLDSIHRNVQRFATAVSAGPASGSAPEPYIGGATGCSLPDPTGTGGCVTGATAWLVAQIATHAHQGPVSCWDRHEWNPSSDHPLGKACDYSLGRSGSFPGPAEVEEGWAFAEWLRAYARQLRVTYVIWQGRIWSSSQADSGWRPYSGGGVYDPTDAVGGHYDHVHVSVAM